MKIEIKEIIETIYLDKDSHPLEYFRNLFRLNNEQFEIYKDCEAQFWWYDDECSLEIFGKV